MRFEKTFIPYGGYWSTPFSKWQGSLSHLNAVSLAAETARGFLARRELSAEVFDSVTFGMTIPQKSSMYAGPWFAGMIGAGGVTGPWIAQACATGARVLASAAGDVETEGTRVGLSVTADRCSNGPHLYYPDPAGMGGTGQKEDWVVDNFGLDPWARNSMIQTAENVAAESKITREEQDAVALRRFEQYQDALADGAAFHKRFMIWPMEIKDARGKRVVGTLEGDEGIFPTTAEGLAKLKPVLPDGTVTFGSQTHPADGNCGMIVSTRERAKELSRDSAIEIQVLSYGQGRAKKGFMAQATVPAARRALDSAGIGIDDCKVIKTHNPFALNDIYFAREMGLDVGKFNNYGSSLIFGHPQGPTGTRLIIEMIEELALTGGGNGLFVGCAAGDTSAAIVVRVGG
ncbi:MAG: thiolase family protein [Acidobacteriota bacterium]|nr:thiolase family protein [Acidobacteriota bacterium]